MRALLDPTNHIRGGLKWGLVAHTVAMFSFVTMLNTIILNFESSSYIDNRGFPGVGNVLPPGPIGYKGSFDISKAVTDRISIPLFPLNQWLLDGLLVSSVSNSVTYACNVGHPSSCIGAMLSIP